MRFLFVDSIKEIKKNEYIRGTKVVSFEEGFLERPYSKKGIFPRTLLLEALGQLASWLFIYSSDFTRQPVVASVEEIIINSDLKPGDTIKLECLVRNINEDGAWVDCAGMVGTQKVIETNNCLVYFVPLEKLQHPEEAKASFKQLTREAVLL